MSVGPLRLIAPLAVTACALAAAAPASARIVPFKSIAGVELGADESAVVKRLGQPSSSKAGTIGGTRVLAFKRRKLEVVVTEGKVTGIETRSRSEKMAGGVGVGTSFATFKRKVRGERCHKLRRYTVCSTHRGAKSMDFVVRSKRIAAVSLSAAGSMPGASP